MARPNLCVVFVTKSFAIRSSLWLYIKVEHGGYKTYLETSQSSNQPEVSSDKQEMEMAKTFSCKFCGKQFSSFWWRILI